MTTTTITVTGMTCGHCVRAVTEELQKVAGVTAVEVELERGLVTIGSDGPLDPDALADAVDDAGYEIGTS